MTIYYIGYSSSFDTPEYRQSKEHPKPGDMICCLENSEQNRWFFIFENYTFNFDETRVMQFLVLNQKGETARYSFIPRSYVRVV